MYLSGSRKRQKEFQEMYEFAEQGVHNLLLIANARWLSKEKAVNRVPEKWASLLLLFTNHALGTEAPDTLAKGRAARTLRCIQTHL
jgi:hypothetical protein